MEQTERKTKSGYRNFVLGLGLLLLTNVLMSVILMSLSKKTLREQIDQRMLDIANTAAYQLDGDVLKTLTADDEGTAGYQQALETALGTAKSKAEGIASASGVSLGKVTKVVEGYQDTSARYAVDNEVYEMAKDSEASGAMAKTMPGQTNITAEVTVTYAIK